ncbi:MAG TPA: hypothetical protein VNR61_13010 [Niallia sp.]|nr:hypothetical protein [Niallia sp.]
MLVDIRDIREKPGAFSFFFELNQQTVEKRGFYGSHKLWYYKGTFTAYLTDTIRGNLLEFLGYKNPTSRTFLIFSIRLKIYL